MRLDKRTKFRLLTLLVTGCLGLVGTEGLLRWREARLRRSDRLDPGMIRYDPRLGWRLTPGWQGTHRHHDFTAQYRINAEGFRHDPALPAPRRGRLIAVVGDSFTFGLGVHEGETFVSRLNRDGPHTYLNLALPGSSTDQQALLIEEVLPRYHPDELWLVVYVGNDLLDNQWARPLQVNAAKPFFERGPDGLRLRNVPVPLTTPAPAPPPASPESVLRADAPDQPGWAEWLAERFRLVRALRGDPGRGRDLRPELEARLAGAHALFEAILARIEQTATRAGVRLRLLLLAGRSFVEEPDSFSAQFQQVHLRRVEAICRQRQQPCVNLAEPLRARYRAGREPFYYRHDGHLTPRGHEVIHQLLREAGETPAQ